MHNLADNIEIQSLGNQLIFRCNGDFASQETIIGETGSGGMTFLKNDSPDDIVQGIFALKHLVLFSKCTNLCSNIELYLKNDYPLIIKYSVASLENKTLFTPLLKHKHIWFILYFNFLYIVISCKDERYIEEYFNVNDVNTLRVEMIHQK